MDKKDLQKSLLISVINYVIILAVSVLVSTIFPGTFDIAWLSIIIISLFLLVYYYYFPTKPIAPLKEGIILGVLLALFTFVIEFILWYSNFGWLYFWNFIIFFQYILIIIIPVFAALLKKEKKIRAITREPNWKDKLSN
ncbi:MAG: hypothetical protein ACTSV5_02355 [Promethearchaeota archaeon]